MLWNKETYEQWTKPFDEGSTYEGDFSQLGGKIRFLSGTGEGMYSVVTELVPNSIMVLKHIGMIDKNGVESPPTDETEKWSGAVETYRLGQSGDAVRLEVTVDCDDEFIDFMNDAFPRALREVKSLSEQQT